MKLAKRTFTIFIAVLAILEINFGALALNSVEWNIQKTLNLDEAPIDMAISSDGKQMFVLTQQGEIIIYSPTMKVEAKLNVGKHVDKIMLAPSGDALILQSRENKTIQIVSLEFIHDINILGSPYKGPQDAPVVIAVFNDFQWPYCARLVPVLEQVLEKYPNEVKYVFKNFPIRSHKFAVKAATAALAAERYGKFWEFHDLLFKNYNKLNDQIIESFALGLDLDKGEFENAMKDPNLMKIIQQDVRDGRNAGVRGTPAIFINGRRLKNRSIEGFQRIIDKLLQKWWKGSVRAWIADKSALYKYDINLRSYILSNLHILADTVNYKPTT